MKTKHVAIPFVLGAAASVPGVPGIVFLLMIIDGQSGTTFHLKAMLHPKLKSVCTAEESRVIHGNIGRRTSPNS